MKTLKTTLIISALVVGAFVSQSFTPASEAQIKKAACDSTEKSKIAVILSDSTADSLTYAMVSDSSDVDSLAYCWSADSSDVDSLVAAYLTAFAGEDTTKDDGCGGDKKELTGTFVLEQTLSDSTEVDSLSFV